MLNQIQQQESFRMMRKQFIQANNGIVSAITDQFHLLLERIYDDAKKMLLAEQEKYDLPIPQLSWEKETLSLFEFIEKFSDKPFRRMQLLYQLVCKSQFGSTGLFAELSPLTMMCLAQYYGLSHQLVFGNELVEDLEEMS